MASRCGKIDMHFGGKKKGEGNPDRRRHGLVVRAEADRIKRRVKKPPRQEEDGKKRQKEERWSA